MKSFALYNEIDPNAAEWTRELIKKGLIMDGEVVEESIENLTPKFINEFTQFHAFSGIGVWAYALRQAGVSDDTPVWTGSCPCQPFSCAGKGKGVDDERHLWPALLWLIRQCRPELVFGEQVAGKAGEAWLDNVSTDLENTGYAVGAAVTAACGFGAPHQRQRVYWGGKKTMENSSGIRPWDTTEALSEQRRGPLDRRAKSLRQEDRETLSDRPNPNGPTNGFWEKVDWLECRGGDWRPIEPSTKPLVNGVASELVPSGNLSAQDAKDTREAEAMRIKGYGNALVSEQAIAFIEAYMGAE